MYLHDVVKHLKLKCELKGWEISMSNCIYLHSNACPKFKECDKYLILKDFILENNLEEQVHPDLLEDKYVPLRTE